MFYCSRSCETADRDEKHIQRYYAVRWKNKQKLQCWMLLCSKDDSSLPSYLRQLRNGMAGNAGLEGIWKETVAASLK
jgi:hypothetical protein